LILWKYEGCGFLCNMRGVASCVTVKVWCVAKQWRDCRHALYWAL